MHPADYPWLAFEKLRVHMNRRRGIGRLRELGHYFDAKARNDGYRPADDPELEAKLDRANDDLLGFLDPGEVSAPSPHEISKVGSLISFPSQCPIGDPRVDRVTVKVYPAPPDAPRVGVLFHPWLFFDGWRSADFVLGPLLRRFRVAAMLAPHHHTRTREGFTSGEGYFNPNPYSIFLGMRQWISDHFVTMKLLMRDFSFDKIVIFGYSVGGFNTLFSTLFSSPMPMVTCCVTNHLARGVARGSVTDQLRKLLPHTGYTQASYARAVRSLHLARWASRIDASRLTWIEARSDTLEPKWSLIEGRDSLAPERIVELPGGHGGPAFCRRSIAREVTRRVQLEI